MQRNVKIAPSILSADLTNLGDAVRLLEEGGADIVHLDVMDGHFVPNISFGPAFARELKKACNLPFDSHLMVSHPMQYAEEFAEAGSEWVTFHVEAEDDVAETIKHIRDLGVKPGICANPCTPFSEIERFVPDVDMVVIMTVNPGFGSQKCMEDQFAKITETRNLIDRLGTGIELEVDGGIKVSNVRNVVDAGASIFVAGSAVFRGERGVAAEIEALMSAANEQP